LSTKTQPPLMRLPLRSRVMASTWTSQSGQRRRHSHRR
jgi:hypothetical protein